MSLFRSWIVIAALLPLTAGSALGQRGQGRPPGDRAEMEQRFRDKFAEVVKQKVGLSDDQMTKLDETNRRFEKRRRELFGRERDIRRSLRGELSASAPNDDRVKKLLDDAFRIQRERLDLQKEENDAMSAYMTATQRARLFGIQEQLRRRMDEMRDGPNGRGRRFGDGGPRPRRPPPDSSER
jgi:hypothetical protein